MEKEKRMYSLNKVTYLRSFLDIEPINICIDEETGGIYYVFDDSQKVAEGIRQFYADQEIHQFLGNERLRRFMDMYKNVVKEIKKKKYESR